MDRIPSEVLSEEIFQFCQLDKENTRLRAENRALRFYFNTQRPFYYVSFCFFLTTTYFLYPYSLGLWII